MAAFTENRLSARLLALGNDLLGDDAFGLAVARETRRRLGSQADIVATFASGLDLLDSLLAVERLVVVDSIQTGSFEPGVIHVFREEMLHPAFGPSPHFCSIFDALSMARELGLNAASEVIFIAVEAADCATVGGPMCQAVEAAIGPVTERVIDLLETKPAGVRYG